ncbi:carbohydrate ABC transporter permease [Nocardioides sp. T2.26MG-1]|uniref:carbohydrate ABC transporter permease n=1 Tax=Nocardioides sp. T2.26MG-1 TaxID=3041166 RepID=UPI0024779D67|nr:carbohydrate ABC transporter permease [Nocardioides sp. T2.26MG-1]CAI9406584.1 L-arabinose transport system permease protein AraQ [Nocardioides sp. T2.26MG-1]
MSTTTAPRAGTRIQTRPVSRLAATGFMAVCTAYFLLPLWWLVVASSTTRGGLTDTSLWFQGQFELLTNVRHVLTYQDGIYLRWMLNSVLYASIGALVGTLIASMAGYALAKYVFPGREVVFNVILAGVLVPATALALPLFLLFSKVDQTDSFWSVLLPSIVSPFGVYLARIYAAAAVPDELLESARLDGAGEFRAFFTISTRLMGPALVTIFLFQFVSIWNNYLLPLVMLQNTKLYPVTLGLATWNSQKAIAGNLQLYVVVGALLSIIPLVIAFLALQRFWQSGLSEGAVK